VPVGHKEYLHLSTFGESDNGHLITNISLCEGDGSESFPAHQYYLNYHLCTPKYQGHYEFFISNDLQALHSVSYAGAVHNVYEQHNEIGIKKLVLGLVSSKIRSFGVSSVTEFLVHFNTLMARAGLLMSGKEDVSNIATEPPTSSAHITESETFTCVPDKDGELKPVITATGILSEDQSTLAEMVRNFFSAWNEQMHQDRSGSDKDGELKPVMTSTGILSEDQSMLAEMVRNVFSAWNEQMHQDHSESVDVKTEEAVKQDSPGSEAIEECQQNTLEPDEDSQCKLQ
jgi:hypothetical protein